MKGLAYVVCLRLGRLSGFPDLYTLWFEDIEGRSVVVADGARISWVGSEAAARALDSDSTSLTISEDPAVLYDVVESIEDLLHFREGAEMRVLNCLNFLDDLVLQLGTDLPSELDVVMIQTVRHLTEGESLTELFNAVGGASRVLALMYAYVGCVLTQSSFAFTSSD